MDRRRLSLSEILKARFQHIDIIIGAIL